MSSIALILSALIAVNATVCPPEITEGVPDTATYSSVGIEGFRNFCDREWEHPICWKTKGKGVSFSKVKEIDSVLRSEFVYRTDRAVYGVDDFYTTNNLCGDCEDYALILAKRLAAIGVDGRYMALILWLPTASTGHATLAVFTEDAGWIEIGVSANETPTSLVWRRGYKRDKWMLMDGKRRWQSGDQPPSFH